MCERSCLLVTKHFEADDPQTKGILPKPIKTYDDGSFDVTLDTISWMFWQCSIGEYCFPEYANEQISAELDKQRASVQMVGEMI